MQGSASSPHVVRFGVFEVDLRAGEVRKSGLKVRLQEKPFQVLEMLLEHPGEIVTREELQKKLWPQDTFVDFNHSMNTAVTKLREALGDTADNPRFVETLARRGYRFIAPVAETPLLRDTGARHGVRLPMPWRVVLTVGALGVLLGVLFGLNVAGLRDKALTAVGARQGLPVPKIESIAVLPLENLSPDPDQEYFADGITDELITNLGKISALRVISRNSVMLYKGKRKPTPEIARELNVDAVVEGAVLRSGNHVRITAQLIDARGDRQLWAETYESETRDVLALQDGVARAIAQQIQAKVTPEEQARWSPTRPVNPKAYEAYLRGRYFWNKRTEEGVRKGIEFFGQALEEDPAYALAYTGLADCYGVLGPWAFQPAKEVFPKAKIAATKALELDDTLAEAHTSLGQVKSYYEWDWVGAEKEFKRAIELNPNYATAHHWYSDYLGAMERGEESAAEIKWAQQLDPLSLIINALSAFRGARGYNQAAEQLRRVVEMDPNFALTHWYLGLTYEQMGQYESAIAEQQKARMASGDSTYALVTLGCAYAKAGKRKQALETLAELKEASKHRYISPLNTGCLYSALGEKGEAFEWLEKAYRERDPSLIYVRALPMLAPLRSDPRFQDLLRRMNFPQ